MSQTPANTARTPSPVPPRLCVMISGGGRTLENLAHRIQQGSLTATIPLVLASRDCPGVALARSLGIPDVRIVKGEIPAHDLEHIFRSARGGPIDWVVLAGYLKYLHVPAGYQGRIVNIHPALLPKFGGAGMYGHHVHEAVIKGGEKVSGCTVHYVDAQYDHGGTILQRTCPVLPGDTPETLAARVFALECEVYPEALQRLFRQDPLPRLGQAT